MYEITKKKTLKRTHKKRISEVIVTIESCVCIYILNVKHETLFRVIHVFQSG